MRRPVTILLALAALSAATHSRGATPPALEPLAFLLGEWAADGGGTPGAASGTARFAQALQGTVIVRTSYAEYSATAERPATRHDDLMVIFAAAGGGAQADYYDNEGHVIHYAVDAPRPRGARFLSEPRPGAPRFRLTYTLDADGVLRGEFAIAAPGKPDEFAPYLTWTSHRVANP
jgi:hypothetical protein